MREFEFTATILAENEDEAWDKIDANDFEVSYLEETLESIRIRRDMIVKKRIKQFVKTETGKMVADYMEKYNKHKEVGIGHDYRFIAKKNEKIADILDYVKEHKEDVPEECKVYCSTYEEFAIQVGSGDEFGTTWYFSESTMEESMKNLEDDY